MVKACYICGLEKEKGYAVKDDAFISLIRSIKKRLGIAKNYSILVCDGCKETYDKKRKNFERTTILYLVIAFIASGALLLLRFSISSLLIGLSLFGLFVFFLLPYYVPSIEREQS